MDDDYNPKDLVIYNLDKQIILKTCSLDSDYYLITSAMDTDKNIIFVTGANGCILTSYSLNSGELKILEIDDELETYSKPIFWCNCYFIPSPINELHITATDHFKYDQTKHKLIKYNNDTSLFKQRENWNHTLADYTAKFVYHKAKSQLLMFQEKCNYILVSKRDDKDENMSDWKKYPLLLPTILEQGIRFSVILGWDQLLFLFDFKDNKDWKIWCLDLSHNNKWHQVHRKLPYKEFGDAIPFVIHDSDDSIHFISFLKDNHNHHFRACLFDLIPMDIIQLNSKSFDPLIIGFIKQFERRNQMIFIPMYLKKLIVQFYPTFV